MYLKCLKPVEGFTVGKIYKLLGVSGEYVSVKDDNKKKVILLESYFEILNK